MKCKLQLNYYKDEDGEYSDSGLTDLNRLKEVIKSNWPNESFVDDLKVILVSKDQQNLILKNCKKDVFEVYYSEDNKDYYHKKSRIELVHECSELFMSSRILDLKNILNKKPTRKKSSIHDFFINHNYKFSKSRNLKELNWFFTMGLPVAIMFVAIPISSIYHGTFEGLNAFFLPLLAIFGLYLWLPGCLLHWQYYYDNKHLKIRLTRGCTDISIEFGGIQKVHQKSDLVCIHKVTYDSKVLNSFFWFGGPPWIDYGYLNLEFKNGDNINITNLLVDQLFIQDKFQYEEVKKLRSRRIFPFIERPTMIKQMKNSVIV